ncbi:MAG: penicillin acylase family protein [Anaerolineae bacterium]
MKRWGRPLAYTLLALFAVVVLAVGAATWWFALRPLPPTQGTLSVAGLSAPVTVYRDTWGVPQIYAQNADDLMLAQGYVQASDRLWQMEMERRTGHGRLSEILGDATLSTDRFLRNLGVTQAAQRDLDIMDPTTRDYLDAYTRGINAYIESHQGNLPLEFTILGVKPAPWQPIDSLVWGKMMAWDLGGNWETELLRARIIALLGEDTARTLMPSYQAGAPLIVPDRVKAYRDLGNPDIADVAANLSPFLAGVKDGVGSNDWVVSGTKTASGKPLLADDPHLSIRLPSVWWEVGLHGGGFDVVGASLVGVPGVIIGHNNRIAWGVTNVGPDVQDLYIEHVRGLDGDRPQYEYQGQWLPMDVRQEVIKVKGKPDETLRVVSTRHGPLLNYVVSGLDQPLAFQWTATREPNELFRSMIGIDRAQNFAEFRDALRGFAVPSQNFVYADVDGNIGYQMPGLVPIRAKGNGLVPSPGWTGEYEWTGYIPFDELPTVVNPPQGYIATANNKVVDDSYPYFISAEWTMPYRAQRINGALAVGQKLTMDDMKALHADTTSLFNQKLAQYLGQIKPSSALQEQALQVVRGWDGRADIDSAGQTIVEATYVELLTGVFGKALPSSVYNDYLAESSMHHMAVEGLLADPQNSWWDDKGTAERETRDDALAKAFGLAVDGLSKRFGDAPTEWTWGRLHTATFQHLPLGQSGIAPLERLFNRGPIAARGTGTTVDVASFNFRQPYAISTLSSYRQVIDLSNLENSVSIHTTGESGQLLSPHYSDMIEAWQSVQYHPMRFSEAALKAAGAEVLTLQPSGPAD